jgi:glycine cleavage system H protein
MQCPEDLRYSKEHEWIRVAEGTGTIGITDFAQQELGDVVFVELPAIGTEVSPGQAFGVVESVKAVSDIYAPVSGTVTAVNERLASEPELLNQDPFGESWLVRVQLSDPAQVDTLMDAASYSAYVQQAQE